jgi:NADH-quinone oxidoreductase subunit L
MLQLAWTIPLLPLAACAVLIFFGSALSRRMGERVGWIGVAGIAATIPVSLGCLAELVCGAPSQDVAVPWAAIGAKTIFVGYMVDPLTAVMIVMVSVVATCIQIYSIGYMHGDARFSRFFAYLSLFCASMFLICLSNNFVMLYAGWELVGLCSYLLIGFWFERKSASDAAKKAFITTRVGDVGFAIGIFIVFSYVPSLLFTDAFSAAAKGTIPAAVAGVAALFLFCGAIGKSAQFPLHTWLPDAMEGPTPVSALIHAATMVAAGVFMVARIFPLFVTSLGSCVFLGLPALTVVGIIGLITALLAALIGVVQNDIKRVLAYSTISQLGYMMCALGLGVAGFAAGMFHLITHAFFKALLFLGSGSVIHGCHEEQDIRKMGGLARRMPVTFATFWAGTLALTGFPLFAGFFSKDEILSAAWGNALGRSGEAGDPASWVFFWGLELGAFLTAFYMGRLCYLTFSGHPRDEKAAHAHESPAVMTVPLVVLAFFAVFLGWIGTPWVAGNLFHSFVHFTPPEVGPTLHAAAGHAAAPHQAGAKPEGVNWAVIAISTIMALGGLFVSALFYLWKVLPISLIKRPLYPLYLLAQRKFYFDEVYAVIPVGLTLGLSWGARLVDIHVVDGIVNAVGWATRWVFCGAAWLIDTFIVDGLVNLAGYISRWTGEAFSRLQNGHVQEYVSGFVMFACGIALAVFVGLFIVINDIHVIALIRGLFGG